VAVATEIPTPKELAHFCETVAPLGAIVLNELQRHNPTKLKNIVNNNVHNKTANKAVVHFAQIFGNLTNKWIIAKFYN